MYVDHDAFAKASSEYQARFEELLARLPPEEPVQPLRLAAPAPTEPKLSAADEKELRTFRDDFARLYREAHDMLFGFFSDPELPNTHAVISRKAIELVGSVEPQAAQLLVAKAAEPDENADGFRLVYEGHFYGETRDGGHGNFLQVLLPPSYFAKLDKIDDVHENTRNNFSKYLAEFLANTADRAALAWALHFLQDVTEPHHASNAPALLSEPMFQFDTHVAFEAHARHAINTRGADFDALARELFGELRPVFRDHGADPFLLEVYERSRRNIDQRIRGGDKKEWDQVLELALPLAIGATAAVLANLPDIAT